MTKKLTPAPPPPSPKSSVKFIRRTPDKTYEHGYVLLGLNRAEDKYIRTGIVGTYEEAANAESFEPSAPHTSTSGGTYYEDLHSRDQGNHTKNHRGAGAGRG